MHKWLAGLVFLASASAFCQGSMAVSSAGNPVVLVGGMGGGTAGGMGGMAGGGMGGIPGGGMTGGGMTGMGGMGGMSGGMSGFGGAPSNSLGGAYGGADPSGGGAEPAQYYLCVTPYDRCSLASSPGSLRRGSSCACSTGHRGTIK